MHLTRHFFLCTMRVLKNVLHNTLAQVSARARHVICTVIHVVRLICSLCSSPCSFPCVSPIPSSSTWTLTCTSSSMWSTSGQLATGTPPTEESGPLAENTPLSGYEPKLPDDFHYSETTEIFFRTNPATRCPRTCLTRNSTTRPSGKRSLHHCSFRSEKNQRTVDKLITLLKKVCCQLIPLSHTQVRGDP